ncbi:zinc finger BED domain-containing protein RICESLEEPER 2-like protein, partial [Tanacetum coccineum]
MDMAYPKSGYGVSMDMAYPKSGFGVSKLAQENSGIFYSWSLNQANPDTP